MQHISELANILNQHLNWNKARITCLAQMVRGIVAVKTVNLTQVAGVFASSAHILSSYRRIQRFFSEYDFTVSVITDIIFSIFPLPRKVILIMDRTNWKLGAYHFNLLVLSIAFQGIALPVFWINLDKAGASNAIERMFAFVKVLGKIGKHRIQHLVADREFIGHEWLKWLDEQEIDFAIRLRSNLIVKRDEESETNIATIFRQLAACKRKYHKKRYWIKDVPVYLSASRAPNGDLLVVATRQHSRRALAIYKQRWEIENLFGCMKSRGFNLETTHLTKKGRIEKMLFVVVIAFCWAYRLGMEKRDAKEIPTKSHKRKSQSLFRYGYDSLRQAVLNGGAILSRLCKLLQPVISKKLGGYVYV